MQHRKNDMFLNADLFSPELKNSGVHIWFSFEMQIESTYIQFIEIRAQKRGE